jgi:hypothetical protein
MLIREKLEMIVEDNVSEDSDDKAKSGKER